jgi:putative ABC transport system permease protein
MVEKKFSLKVSGVYEDLPKNSHIRPSYLIPIVSFGKMQNWPDFYNWGTYSFRNYVLLKKNTNPKLIDNKIANIINDNTHDPVKTKLYLNPLSKLYIMPEDKNDFLVVIGIYGMVAIFILLLASFNYINLSTANSSLRAKEIGIRKVSGSGKAQLISQFLCESLAIAFIAIILAFFLSELTLPLFNKTVDRELTLSYIKDWKFVLKMISITFLNGSTKI